MLRPVKVTVMGKTFTMQTDEDEAHVQRVARLVDGRVAELRQKQAPEAMLAVLAALMIADDLVKERRRHGDMTDEAILRAENVQARLLQALGEA